MGTHFLRIPKNIRSLEVSSGIFSGAFFDGAGESDAGEGAVEASEFSKEPEDADAIAKQKYQKMIAMLLSWNNSLG